jgi:hypothetical protein
MAQLQPLFEKSKTPVFDALVTIIANGAVHHEEQCPWLDTVVKTFETLSELHARESGLPGLPANADGITSLRCCQCKCPLKPGAGVGAVYGPRMYAYCRSCDATRMREPIGCECTQLADWECGTPKKTTAAAASVPVTCSVCVSPLSVGETLMLDDKPYCLTCSSRT